MLLIKLGVSSTRVKNLTTPVNPSEFGKSVKKDKDNRFNQYENLFPNRKDFKDKGFDHNTKELEKMFKNKYIQKTSVTVS